MFITWKFAVPIPIVAWATVLLAGFPSLADQVLGTGRIGSDNGAIAADWNAFTAVQPSSGMEQVPTIADLNQSDRSRGMAQVTSVSQFLDVNPTDWAFQALQSLVERYGCIVGYPDKTYRGNRALTRYEFAAGLNACLDKIQELIAAATADFVRKEDLEVVKRLQEEFAAELAALRGSVEALEVRTATLEKQQFSTTTKLTGNVWFNLTGAFAGDDVTAERSLRAPNSAFAPPQRDANNRPTRVQRQNPEITFGYYTFLNFNTSFTGKDLLVTQLVAGNGNSPANQFVSAGFFNSWGTPFLDQTGVVNATNVSIRELFYQFPVGDNLRVVIGPRVNHYRYFDANRFTFFLTGASSFQSNGSTLMNAVDRGSGAVVVWTINPQFQFTAAYLAENTEFLNPAVGFNTSSNPAFGLFNSTNTITAQLLFSPSRSFNLRLIYNRSSLRPTNGFIGGAAGEPLPYGYADDGFGGQLKDSGADTFVANFDWLITKNFGVFGRYSYGVTDINPRNSARSGGKIRVQSFQAGLGFPDLGKKGALGVLSFVVPFDYLSGTRFLLSGAGDGGTQYELEASYYYPINDNLALVPAFYAIFNPNNFDSNPTVFVGNLRAQFSF
ncbi:'Carbohydrate-selective porin, OprB family',S-layer domain containing protein [Leptolyngbyaceae cyanobacterium JSC-12]|nr:'Carbohydrate-selective porin, OprB family',S-layer domain containing protein [Leptolyngbyaceae cyanobacterium JSC-12]